MPRYHLFQDNSSGVDDFNSEAFAKYFLYAGFPGLVISAICTVILAKINSNIKLIPNFFASLPIHTRLWGKAGKLASYLFAILYVYLYIVGFAGLLFWAVLV